MSCIQTWRFKATTAILIFETELWFQNTICHRTLDEYDYCKSRRLIQTSRCCSIDATTSGGGVWLESGDGASPHFAAAAWLCKWGSFMSDFLWYSHFIYFTPNVFGRGIQKEMISVIFCLFIRTLRTDYQLPKLGRFRKIYNTFVSELDLKGVQGLSAGIVE